MPTQCPEGFDPNVWEKVKDKELNDSFLLVLASELNKQKHSICDVCKCLDVDSSQLILNMEEITCYSYQEVLVYWQHAAGKENGVVGKLICCLSKLTGINYDSLCKICTEHFKTNGMC